MPNSSATASGSNEYRSRSRFLFLGVSLVLMAGLGGCRERHTASLALLGDLMLSRGVLPGPGSLSYLGSEISSADLAMANLESPLAPNPPEVESAYNLCASSGHASLLGTWGFDLLSLANNHALDCSQDGLAVTISALDAAGIQSIAPGTEAVYREVNGLQLAFLAFDDVSSPLDVPAAETAIRSARDDGAQVIVSVHWGLEYQGSPSDRQESLAGAFSRAGAALIWGHHPHVLQRVAWIENDGQKTLVLYSLGNALFDQGGLADTRRSALLMVTIGPSGVESVHAVPFTIDVLHSRLEAPDASTVQKIQDSLQLP
jgi:poly-gamma-glutamate synthesis protein (capsule biosynthesis protein)